MFNIKWFGFMLVVWIVGILLGSSFEAHGNVAAGQDYATGTATFTKGSPTVVGAGTTWVSDMEGGIIQLDSHGYYFKIESVEDSTHLTLTSDYPYSTAGGAYTMREHLAWAGTTQESTLDYLLNPKNIVYQESNIGAVSWWTAPLEYFQAWFKVITWDFAFLQDTGYELIRWIVLIPFSVTMVAGLIILFIQLLQGFVRL